RRAATVASRSEAVADGAAMAVFTYPFPFWGTGYDEDRAAPHLYEVRFAAYVDFVDRPPLARAFEEALSATQDADLGCGLTCDTWLWAADWALLRFRQTPLGADADDYPFATYVEGVLEALHRRGAALAEAVALDAPAGWRWPWHDETVAGQP